MLQTIKRETETLKRLIEEAKLKTNEKKLIQDMETKDCRYPHEHIVGQKENPEFRPFTNDKQLRHDKDARFNMNPKLTTVQGEQHRDENESGYFSIVKNSATCTEQGSQMKIPITQIAEARGNEFTDPHQCQNLQQNNQNTT